MLFPEVCLPPESLQNVSQQGFVRIETTTAFGNDLRQKMTFLDSVSVVQSVILS